MAGRKIFLEDYTQSDPGYSLCLVIQKTKRQILYTYTVLSWVFFNDACKYVYGQISTQYYAMTAK